MYKSIVFSGGGMRGIAFVGALRALIEGNLVDLDRVNKFVGTSIGAVLALFLATGHTIDEIESYVVATDFGALAMRDICVSGFVTRYGLYSGKAIVSFLRDCTARRHGGVRSMTFQQLYEATGSDLTVVGACVNDSSVTYFNRENTPNADIHDAVRISLGIPYIFTSVTYRGNSYVDGGIFDNFAMDNDDPFCLGLRLVSSTRRESGRCSISNVAQFSQCIATSLLRRIDDMSCEQMTHPRVYYIDIDSKYTLQFDMSAETKGELVASGSRQVTDSLTDRRQRMRSNSI